MYLVEIEIVGLQAAQAVFHGAEQMLARQAEVVRPFAHGKACLGSDDQLVAVAVAQPAPDNLLGDAARVDIGCINEISAGLDKPIHHLDALGFGALASEGHGAQAKLTYFQARAAKIAIVHGKYSFRG